MVLIVIISILFVNFDNYFILILIKTLDMVFPRLNNFNF